MSWVSQKRAELAAVSPVVYLGPSLDRSEAESLLAAEYRPPIRRGDLETVEPGRTVVILDGEFDQSLSVSPKEILRRLDTGSAVLGAASIGALRAAELALYGMIGIGRVFELYRTGCIDGDDEVAVSYCPLTMKAHTIPLVNIRCWVELAACAGCLHTSERERILRRVRARVLRRSNTRAGAGRPRRVPRCHPFREHARARAYRDPRCQGR